MNLLSNEKNTHAILVVSFGTSYEETCQKTICAIEKAIHSSFSEYSLYRAWTSKRIIKKLKTTRNISIDTVSEAMIRMKTDGITDVIVQPTHVINGIESDILVEELKQHISDFNSIRLGTPLLTSTEDCNAIADILCHTADRKEDDHLYILMGHGTEHQADQIYTTMNEILFEKGRPDIMIGTVEGKIQISDIIEYADSRNIKKATLLPFMIVAGDHANNDMAGEEDDSWKNLLAHNGITSDAILKGLGEYPEIRDAFIEHCKNAKELRL